MAGELGFIFSNLTLVRPRLAALTLNTSLPQTPQALLSFQNSLFAVGEGLRAQGLVAPDLYAAISAYPNVATAEAAIANGHLAIAGYLREVDQKVWTQAMTALGGESLQTRRFTDPADFAAYVRQQLGVLAGQTDSIALVRAELTSIEVDGTPENGMLYEFNFTQDLIDHSKEVVGDILRSVTTRSHPYIRLVVQGFSQHVDAPDGVVDFLLQHFSSMPAWITYVELELQMGEERKTYFLRRGEEGLQVMPETQVPEIDGIDAEPLFEPLGKEWEVLSIASPKGPYAVLLRMRSTQPPRIEIHLDPAVVNRAKKGIPEIFAEGVGRIADRPGLADIILVWDMQTLPGEVIHFGLTHTQSVFVGANGYQGTISVAMVTPQEQLVVSFRRNALQKVEAARMRRLTDIPVAPRLYTR